MNDDKEQIRAAYAAQATDFVQLRNGFLTAVALKRHEEFLDEAMNQAKLSGGAVAAFKLLKEMLELSFMQDMTDPLPDEAKACIKFWERRFADYKPKDQRPEDLIIN